MTLQRRDIALLTEVYAYGSMLRGQIQTLYFGSLPRTNARLRQLYDARYLQRAELSLPTEPGQPVGCQLAYLLGPAGIPIVASEFGIDPADVRAQLRHGTPGYLLHTIEIVRFRMAVENAAKNCTRIVLEQFLAERLCRHSYEVREKPLEGTNREPRWRREIFKPDAVFLISNGSERIGFAVEIDRGHTSSSEFAQKLAIHTRYVTTGLFTARYEVRYGGTLIVTTSARRRDNLAAIAEKTENGVFQLATFYDIRCHGAFGQVWHIPGEGGAQTLF